MQAVLSTILMTAIVACHSLVATHVHFGMAHEGSHSHGQQPHFHLFGGGPHSLHIHIHIHTMGMSIPVIMAMKQKKHQGRKTANCRKATVTVRPTISWTRQSPQARSCRVRRISPGSLCFLLFHVSNSTWPI